jgi:hypothetical protein
VVCGRIPDFACFAVIWRGRTPQKRLRLQFY